MVSPTVIPGKKPPFRKLRGYAFDPSLSLQLDTVDINLITYKIPWEELEPHPVTPGLCIPSGEYVEIIDYDPASGLFYSPVNLNDTYVLAQDGLEPSVSSPQFHQQMLYAVVMTTINNFERALGRKVQWGEHLYHKKDEAGNYILTNTGRKKIFSDFVQRLRIYPHALRQGNAYYNPQKKSLLFGYFPAAPANVQLHLPGGTVFTCLSHDIIAHETTHAILDGLHRRYTEPTNPDTRAFHEAFADIVALFQHFTFPPVLRQQIAKTRGDLSQENLLGQLAVEFGKALGNYGGLRDAIGHKNEKGEWIQHVPNPRDYQTKLKFHDRGAILVAAVFEVFISLYRRHSSSIIRIASGGTGKLIDGDLHPDLVDTLAQLASETASRILTICVRALDYCPPVDINYGDYLRAIITSDIDMVREDLHSYRIAFIEAFQKRGIFPKDIKSMSVESLCYPEDHRPAIPARVEQSLIEFLKFFKEKASFLSDRKKIYELTKKYIGGNYINPGEIDSSKNIHERFSSKLLEDDDSRERFGKLTGLYFPSGQVQCEQAGLAFSADNNNAKFEIGNLWLASRVTPDGGIVNHVIITIMQKRGVDATIENGLFRVNGYFIPDPDDPPQGGRFIFRGGVTLIFDLDTEKLKYVIRKDIRDTGRMEQQYRLANNLLEGAESMAYFDEQSLEALSGPFAFMHNHSSTH
ncbi:MAG: hypothetical protein KA821_03945 [Chitinophagaceae bacterium]|nr:hypothetical protein [Chitinophagaceae bacterium]